MRDNKSEDFGKTVGEVTKVREEERQEDEKHDDFDFTKTKIR